MATVTEVITAIQTRLTGLSGIVLMPAYPPEDLALIQLPAILSYPQSGAWGPGAATPPPGVIARTENHTINVDVHVHRFDLALNVAALMPFADSVPLRLMTGFREDRFDSTVFSMGPADGQPIRYELLELKWGGLETLGWRFSIDVVLMNPSS